MTITKKLWFSFGLLISVLLVSMLISSWQIQQIYQKVLRVVEVENPLEEAILEIKINVGESSGAVLHYVWDSEARKIEKIHDAKADFEKFTAKFDKLAETDEEKRLGQEVVQLYEEFKRLGDEIIMLVDKRHATLLLFREDVSEIDELIDEEFQAAIDRNAPDAIKKLEAALDMEINIDEAFVAIEAYIAQRDSALVQEILNEKASFNKRVSMYRETSLSADEERWLNQISNEFEEAMKSSDELVADTDKLHEFLGQFEATLDKIDIILDDIQFLIHTETIKAVEETKAATTTTAILLIVLGGGGISIGLISAWTITRGVIKPVTHLVRETEIIGRGMLNHRVIIQTNDEFGKLAAAFNQMLENIEQAEDKIRKLNDELEQRVVDRTRKLSALYEVTTIASESLDLRTTLERSLERVLETMRGNVGAIHLLDKTQKILHLTTQRNLPSDIVPQIDPIASWVIKHGEPLLVSDMATDSRIIHLNNFHTYVGVPMRARGRTLGVLSVFGETKQQLNMEEVTLLTSIADQVGVAVENARLRQRAEQAAVMEERERLARELHDSVTQSLYSLTLFAEAGTELIKTRDLDSARHNFVRMGETAQHALKEMRLLVYELRPLDLQQEGLVGALHRRLSAVEGRVNVKTQLVAEEFIELPTFVEKQLYRIAQEALNNILKHATASSVTVYLRVKEEQVELELVDDGSGFDPDVAGDTGGIGLISMRERAEKVGGSLTIHSTPGEGTRVTVSMSKNFEVKQEIF
ncbi:GAF domain-containing protein [Anaerolineales bacterium HSG6]|nr:GAF domain-containing protein [Anaerolineales bacterium HSG6]MDM8530792.1 GAF domain-containing protein [Anaerolineales bacterium HSG25]